jgi:hypothetical protein
MATWGDAGHEHPESGPSEEVADRGQGERCGGESWSTAAFSILSVDLFGCHKRGFCLV